MAFLTAIWAARGEMSDTAAQRTRSNRLILQRKDRLRAAFLFARPA